AWVWYSTALEVVLSIVSTVPLPAAAISTSPEALQPSKTVVQPTFFQKPCSQLHLADCPVWQKQTRSQLTLLAQSANPSQNETQTPPVSPPEPSDEPTVPPTEIPEVEPTTAPDRFLANEIRVTGSTILEPEDIRAITAPLEGTEVTIEDLRQTADRITQLYLERDFITSRAVLADQDIVNGIVQIQVVEGKVSEILIEGNTHVNQSYIRDRIELGAGVPLSTSKLEDQLRLLRTNPLFENIEASLRAGTGLGESVLLVRVTEAPRFGASVSVDNYSPPSVGSERLVLSARYRNLTGLGDELAAGYNRSTAGGTDVFDFSYRIPLNAMDGTLQLRAAPSRNRVLQEASPRPIQQQPVFGPPSPPLDPLEISGERELYEVSFRQPLIRSPRQELALSLGFSYQNGQTFLFDNPFSFGIGPDTDGESRTSVFQFGQDYVRRDTKGAWAFRSSFNFGTGLFDATDSFDGFAALSPTQAQTISQIDTIPDGQFFSWLGQIQRVQRLSENNLVIAQLDVQLTPDPLLPAHQFVIGGGLSVRGFRQNARSGDNGFRFSLEDRIALGRNAAGLPTFQLIPFIDAGGVWNVSRNPNTPLDQRFLVGTGLGLLWEPEPRVRIRLDYAIPLIELDDRGNNAQDDGFYFSVGYGF
ncbi:MAG: ShlB/FhaC/HecB family hemolysin secretion/activation protein, partial [Geitlerinemataceae cyanobacterium]